MDDRTQGEPRTAADDLEREWFQHVYAGDSEPQLTLRAVVMGLFLGVYTLVVDVPASPGSAVFGAAASRSSASHHCSSHSSCW